MNKTNNKKENKKFLIKFLKFLFLFAFLQCWFATQYFAYKVYYNPILDGIKIKNYKIYSPFSYIVWKYKYKNEVPKVIKHVNEVVYMTSLIGLLIMAIVLSKKNASTVHGTAKWADRAEIKKLDFDRPHGLVLGCNPYTSKIMRDHSDRHAFMGAPTRMGKGINSATPTAYDWDNSIIINDIKGELWGLTSGYRKHILGQKVFCFAPLDTDGISCQFNSLDFIAIGTGKELEDVAVISQTLIDVDGKGESDHWITSAINLINGIILHVRYSNPKASLVDVVEFLTPPNISLVDQIADILGVPREMEENEVGVALRNGDTKQDIKLNSKGEMIYPSKGYACFDHLKHFKDKKLFKKIYNCEGTDRDLEGRLHPLVAREFMAFFKTPDRERGSILSTATQKLKIFLDPIIAQHIRKSDFTIKQLMEEKCTLYLVTPPKNLYRTKSLLRLIFTQVVFELTDRMSFNTKTPKKLNFIQKLLKPFSTGFSKFINYFFPKVVPEKNRLLLMIDEATALGKLDIIEQSMAYAAGYNIKFFIIAQSLNQFKKIYGENNYIIDNCSIQIFLTPNDDKTPKMLSDMFDTYTEKVRNESKRGFQLVPTYSWSYVPRKLMTPGEVRTLPYEDIILMVTGQNPIKGKKLFYYKDKRYDSKKLPGLEKSDINEEFSKKNEIDIEKLNKLKVIEKKEEEFTEKLEIFNTALKEATDDLYEEIATNRSNFAKKYFDELYQKEIKEKEENLSKYTKEIRKMNNDLLEKMNETEISFSNER